MVPQRRRARATVLSWGVSPHLLWAHGPVDRAPFPREAPRGGPSCPGVVGSQQEGLFLAALPTSSLHKAAPPSCLWICTLFAIRLHIPSHNSLLFPNKRIFLEKYLVVYFLRSTGSTGPEKTLRGLRHTVPAQEATGLMKTFPGFFFFFKLLLQRAFHLPFLEIKNIYQDVHPLACPNPSTLKCAW